MDETFCILLQANIGQEEDFEAAREKALKLGAIKVKLKLCKIEIFCFYIYVSIYRLTYLWIKRSLCSN